MRSLPHDLIYAVRMLRRRPGVAFAAVATLALGIGATSAIFAVVNSVLLEPLPYATADRIAYVSIAANTGFGDRTPLPVADLLAWQAANRASVHIAAYSDVETETVSGDGSAESVHAVWVTASFFDVLAVDAAIGRVWHDRGY